MSARTKVIRSMMLFVSVVLTSGVALVDTWTDPDTGYMWTYRVNGDAAENY